MAERPLDRLGLCEAELRALGRAAQSRFAGQPIPQAGKFRRKTPASAGGNFRGLREYIAGDSLRTINWRASARSSQIQTQIYESELASQWFICLDGSASMGVGAGQNKWLLARQIAAAFAYLLLYCGNQAGLLVFSGKVDAFCPPGRSHSQYPKLLNLLDDCRPRPAGGESLLASCASRLSAGASILAISDFLDDGSMEKTLGWWRGSGFRVQAIQILAADECELPVGEPLCILDIETAQRRLLNADTAAIHSATARLREVTARLDDYCCRRGIPFTLAESGRGWKQAVLEHLSKVNPRP